jgi:hypothetical protein
VRSKERFNVRGRGIGARDSEFVGGARGNIYIKSSPEEKAMKDTNKLAESSSARIFARARTAGGTGSGAFILSLSRDPRRRWRRYGKRSRGADRMVRRNVWDKPWHNLGWKIPCTAPDVQRDKINAPDPVCPLRFRLIVVDVCDKGKTIYTSRTITVNF